MKLPFFATTLTLIGTIILCTLGTWQLQRLEWKNDIIEKIQTRNEAEFKTFTAADMTPENEFLKGDIEGRYIYEKSFAITPRTYEEKMGVHIIIPFEFKSGEILLSNAGWAPKHEEHQTIPPRKWVHTAGTIRKVPQTNYFTPENNPEKDEWYHIDIDQIAKAKNLDNVLPVIFYEIDLLDGGHGVHYPTPLALKTKLPNNNHLQYALFWYAMAAALLAIYYLRFIRKKP